MIIRAGLIKFEDIVLVKTPLKVNPARLKLEVFYLSMETKVCSKCKKEKELTEFKKAKGYFKGVNCICRTCDATRRRERRKENPELYKERARTEYYNNKEKRLESSRKWKAKNKEYLKKWGENHRNKDRERYNKLAQANREKHRENYNKRQREKRKNDPLEKIKWRIRNNISKAIKNKKFTRNGTTEKYLGCTYDFFIQYIEAQFTKGMN